MITFDLSFVSFCGSQWSNCDSASLYRAFVGLTVPILSTKQFRFYQKSVGRDS